MKSKSKPQTPTHHTSFQFRIATFLSFFFALTTSSILGSFIDALLRENLPIPWPIMLVMAAACVNVTVLLVASLLRCFRPSSTLILLILHVPLGLLWLVTTAVFGRELSQHLKRGCPSADLYGGDLRLVCQLYKALFSFTVISTACALWLVALDIFEWRRLKREAKYMAMERNTGQVMTPSAGSKKRGNDGMGLLKGMFKGRRKERGMEEDERSIMMTTVSFNEDGKVDEVMKPEYGDGTMAAQTSSRQRLESSSRGRMRVGEYEAQFSSQETRYDPTARMV